MIFINGFMQKHTDIYGKKVNSLTLFFPAIFNPAQAGFLCSPEHGKLCFEALETEFVPQNNLPLQGAENTFRSQGFCRN
jgi:hypothetical protein